jgi:hypothetical protein
MQTHTEHPHLPDTVCKSCICENYLMNKKKKTSSRKSLLLSYLGGFLYTYMNEFLTTQRIEAS